jgi:hypothetical protein
VGVFVEFRRVPGSSLIVQLVDGMSVLMLGFLALCVNVDVRMLVGVCMLMSVRVHGAIRMLVLVRMSMCVDMGVQVLVFDLSRHGVLLIRLEKGRCVDCVRREFYVGRH